MKLFSGLMFACFGTSYSAVLVHVLYRGSLSNTAAPLLLAVYCLYIPLVGLNGMDLSWSS